VIEVAASIQFPDIPSLDVGRLGLLWAEYRARYPRVEHHPQLNPAVESFEAVDLPGIEFSVEQTMPTPRLWFLNAQGTRLLQVQQGRFILNWRKLETDEAYPHYPDLRETLFSEFEVFRAFLAREGLPAPEPNQGELTYVNHIDAVSAKGGRRSASEVITLWRDAASSVLPEAESASLECRYVMPREGPPFGRLHVKLESRLRIKNRTPVYVLSLMGRGGPLVNGGVFGFLDEAHRWIVQSFADLTTAEMHNTWGRTR
jgi:uncharacterized protein (TIGR04255 family)